MAGNSARARLALVGLAAAAAALAAPAPALADWTCQASAVRGVVIGSPAFEPAVAGRGDQACVTDSATSTTFPSPLSATALASTTSTGTGADRQVLAVGGLGSVRVQSLPTLPLTVPTATIPDSFGALTVDLSALTDPLNTIPDSVTVDARPAVQALLPNRQLPTTDLLNISGATAYAGGACQDGKPYLFATKNIGEVTVLGQRITDLGQTVERTGTLLDTASIDPSSANVRDVPLPKALTDLGITYDTAIVGPELVAAVDAALDTLPDVAIPAAVARVKVTPGQQARSADALAQEALRAEVDVLGTRIADLIIGAASVSSAGADCATAAQESSGPVESAGDALLQCTSRRLVLENVVLQKRRVKLLGFADKKYAGKTVKIRFTHSGRTVGSTKVRDDGRFRVYVDRPAKRLIGTNKARYEAVLGRQRSRDLKLTRRMELTGIAKKGGKVIIAGRVVRPLAKPVARIEVRRRVSCKKTEVVGYYKPKSNGRFRIKVDAPTGEAATVYRLTTRVRNNRSNPKTYPTFTLPRAVNLG